MRKIEYFFCPKCGKISGVRFNTMGGKVTMRKACLCAGGEWLDDEKFRKAMEDEISQ